MILKVIKAFFVLTSNIQVIIVEPTVCLLPPEVFFYRVESAIFPPGSGLKDTSDQF
jgi:hypothetical protein